MVLNKAREGGLQTFFVIWFGQLISLLGTSMTRFGLITWAYQQTEQATTLALLGFFSFILYVLVSPVAGVLVDRWDRRWVMIGADLGAGLMTVGILVLHVSGGLEIWHLYIAEALTGAFEAFQLPAYRAATTLIVPKKHYGRANGFRALASDSARVFAPFLAGLVLVGFDLKGVLLIDIVTFIVAICTLMLVRIPRPQVTAASIEAGGRMVRQIAFGFRYIVQRRGLLWLLLIYMGINLMAALTWFGVLNAMVLARSGGNELALATVQSAMGVGAVIGGILISTWGGPKKRIHGVLAYAGLSFLLGDMMFGIGQSVSVWATAAFVGSLFIPFIVTCDRTIWQLKVPPDVQGRVFAVTDMLRTMTMPVGYLLAGPMADRVFEPAMMPGGALSPVFGSILGTGPGAGMGLMFMMTAILGMTISLSGYLIPAIRSVESDLPDYDAVLVPAEAA